jgi:hypothetical protein
MVVMTRGAAEIAELERRRKGRPVGDGCGALGRAAALVLAAMTLPREGKRVRFAGQSRYVQIRPI